ncbi:hypothetical protein [Loigolactobacillus binensis]|uniref:Uncharacterized protein n=1 Tax=Loigolactobacillus binensis TaxID=2559922 RepID=A0ABW3ECB9_9LACO|nr:hypothetical protein [Loigolactobacillus binensis]
MTENSNYVKKIIKQVDILQSNKLDSEESINYFTGFMYSLILDKTVFKRNDELPDFIFNFFLKPFGSMQYKDYVYKSRTLLGARVCRHIIDDFNYSDTVKLSKIILNYLEKKYALGQDENAHKKLNSIANELSGWLNQ